MVQGSCISQREVKIFKYAYSYQYIYTFRVYNNKKEDKIT